MRCMKVVLPEPGGELEEVSVFKERILTCHAYADNSYRLSAWWCL
jgi:hypothetical protein